MNEYDLDELKQARQIVKETIDLVKELNTLETGILFGVSAGLIVASLLLTQLLWIFAASSSALFLYRCFVLYFQWKELKAYSRLQVFDMVVQRKELIWTMNIPETEKKKLSSELDRVLVSLAPPKTEKLLNS